MRSPRSWAVSGPNRRSPPPAPPRCRTDALLLDGIRPYRSTLMSDCSELAACGRAEQVRHAMSVARQYLGQRADHRPERTSVDIDEGYYPNSPVRPPPPSSSRSCSLYGNCASTAVRSFARICRYVAVSTVLRVGRSRTVLPAVDRCRCYTCYSKIVPLDDLPSFCSTQTYVCS